MGLMVLVIGIALMAVLSWQAAGRLPDPVTLAGTGKHGADQHAPKLLVLIGIPLLTLMLSVVLLASQRLRRLTAGMFKVPLWRDDHSHRRAVGLALGVLTPTLLSLHLMVLRAAEGRVETTAGYIAAAVAIVVVVAGNFWPKQVPAIPETLVEQLPPGTRPRWDQALEAQRRALRPTGIIMVALGLVALACSWSVPTVSLGISLSAVVAMAGVPLGTAWRTVASTRSR
ncbi:hypothetical protein CLV67_113248 [Actinoplanes italicus]|uniref:Uncharacterized protein n=2 Tax=Actinoplanes italicus TaxID=113567 RepID=A0A2T0K602_9ACTN|nr:hypothetical protein CLV67_113248 [Actinoplanes italicus]